MPHLRLRDLIDILIVTLLVYQVLLLVRRTRAVQLAFGLLVLFAVYMASRVLKLNTLQWILSYMGVVIPFALLVIFQPELRRMLEQLGRGGVFVSGFGAGLGREETIQLVNNVARACRVLSSRKTGALIVLERRTGLNDVIESGIKIDALVTVQLLITTFFPNTPLHDGAVVIRGNRLMAAGCLLPLSENPHLSRALGTRHRAALGISESTDAVAVVVSEETGAIAVARDGQLARGLSEEELKVMLLGLLAQPPSRGPVVWPWRRTQPQA
ncbi:MAG: TIGR00159 family protein [Armatimonadetes bacterium]|nr:TIGR00159 family protein [Armatimonadota bacterium]